MTLNELCRELNLPSDKTRLMVSCYRGNVLCWSLKELLCHEYYRLSELHQQALSELFIDLVTDKPIMAHGKSDAFVKAQMVIPDSYLHRFLVSYSRGNPFGVEVLC